MPEHPAPPDQTPEAMPYWEAANEERLVIQRCENEDVHVFPPRSICPYCYEDSLAWEESTGAGSVYAFTIIHHQENDYWAEKVPYVNALVRLDEEDVFLYSEIVNCDPEEVTAGMDVQVTFEQITDDVTLPQFEPTS